MAILGSALHSGVRVGRHLGASGKRAAIRIFRTIPDKSGL